MKIFSVILIAVLLAGCGPTVDQMTATAVLAQAQTQSAAPTSTSTRIPTPTATNTPTVRETAEKFFEQGEEFLRNEVWASAVEEFSKAISVDPDFAEAYINRGLAYYSAGDDEAAISDFETALNLDFEPQTTQMWVNRGRVNSILGNIADSIADFDKAIKIDPEFVEAYVRRGYIYGYDLYEYEQAFADFNRAIAIDPDYALIYQRRGFINGINGDYKAAIDDFSKALELKPEASETFLERGHAYAAMGEFDLSIDDLSKAITLNPELTEAYVWRGDIYARQLGETDLAFEDFNKAIALDPDDMLIYQRRGFVYEHLGEYEAAIEDHTTAIHLNPEAPDSYLNRGYAYWSQGNYDLAITDLNQAIELDPDLTYAHYYLGLIYFDTSASDQAIIYLEKAVELGLDQQSEEYAQSVLSDIKITAGQDYDGIYRGTTSQGSRMEIQIVKNSIFSLSVEKYDTPNCDNQYNSISTIFGDPKVEIVEGIFFVDFNDMKIQGSFTSPTEISGTMEIKNYFCEESAKFTWSASSEFTPTSSIPTEDLLPLIPDLEIPEALFIADAGSSNISEPVEVLLVQGDWSLVKGANSIFPVPAGWTIEENLFEIYIVFSPEGVLWEPSIRIRFGDLGDIGDDRTSEEIMDEMITSAEEYGFPASSFKRKVVDANRGYFSFYDGEDNLYLFSKDTQGLFHFIQISTAPEDWDNYYPIIQAIVDHWVDLDSKPLGMAISLEFDK